VETLQLKTIVGEDRRLTITLPSNTPPGPVEVVVIVNPIRDDNGAVRLADFYGVGKDLRTDQDAQEHVNGSRDEWER
jgi:hypothetical protein